MGHPTRQTFDQLLNAKKSDEILASVTRCIWEADTRQGEPPIPSLTDIQEIYTYSVEVSDENGRIQYTYPEAIDEPFLNRAQTIHFDFNEEKAIVSHTKIGEIYDYNLIAKEKIDEGSTDYFQAISNFFTRFQRIPQSEHVEWAHHIWKAVEKKDEKLQHPLTQVVREWLKNTDAKKITAEYDRKHPVGILKHPTGCIRQLSFIESEIGRLREFATPARVHSVASDQLRLFGGDEKISVLPAVMPLEIAHPAGLTPTTKRGAVSHTVRIFFEALMALQPTETQADIMFTLGDLISYLYPDGKFNRTNQLKYIIEALDILHSGATVPYEWDTGKIGDWRPVVVRTRIRNTDGNETRIFLDVKLPPDARQGMAVDKHTLRLLGKTSAPKFNAYLTAAWIWDKYGTHNGNIIDPTKPAERRNDEGFIVDPRGRPILTERGKPVKNIYDTAAVRQLDRMMNPEAVKQYPILSNDDLIASCYPEKKNTSYTRADLQRAKMYWTDLEAEGIVRIERRQYGWRILPSELHIALYRGLKEAQKRR